MRYLIFILLFLSVCLSAVEKMEGRAIWIMDGDTFILLGNDKKHYTIRVYGIDAPEKNQPYGYESMLELIKLIGRKHVRLVVMDTDRYKRKVAKVYVGKGDKKYINLQMIQAGAAWHYKAYSQDKDLSEAEQDASQKNIGLWEPDEEHPDAKPIPPWIYRRLQSRE